MKLISMKRSSCLVCGSRDLSSVVDLGTHPNADTFTHTKIELHETPLEMVSCNTCGHCQLLYEVTKESRYTDIEYSYTSSNSSISRNHFEELALYVKNLIKTPDKVSKIMEPGSNDGYLLNALGDLFTNALLVGVDPCSITSQDIKGKKINNNIIRIKEFFESQNICGHENSADIIIATNVLNHSDSPNDFIKTCAQIIKPNGYLIVEVPDVTCLSENLYFETIYHEHVNYFSPYSLNRLASNHGFHVVDITRTSYMCGSLRAAFRFDAQKSMTDHNNLLIQPWMIRTDFEKKCKNFKKALNELIIENIKSENVVIGLGASTKANTLLNYCNLSSEKIKYLTDVSINKIGKYSPKSSIKVQHPKDIYDLIGNKNIVGIPITVNISSLLKKEAECYNFNYVSMPSRL